MPGLPRTQRAARPPRDLADARRQLDAVLRQVPVLGFVLPGTITRRLTKCTTRRCHCQSDPSSRHGPYFDWTRKVEGTTVSARLSREDARLLRGWIRNRRRLGALVAQLEQISLGAFRAAAPAGGRAASR